MSYLIRCSTLFDITVTGVRHRTCPVDYDQNVWLLARNQQCNFDTIVQSISIRSLPELVSTPKLIINQKHKFGSVFKPKCKFWQFEFTVGDITVWQNDTDYLYHLYADCADVPMIICGTEVKNLNRTLCITEDCKNVDFELIKT